jgi:drug/metabolite transporter (DMT)-like permease
LNKNSLLERGRKHDKVPIAISKLLELKLLITAKLKSELIALVILSIAIIALAFSPILTKLSEVEISPEATIFNRLWISTMIMGVWQINTTPESSVPCLFKTGLALDCIPRSEDAQLAPLILRSPVDHKQQALLILASIAATGSALSWAFSLTQTSVASSTVLRSLTPLFISFGGWLVLKQRFERKFLLGMSFAIVGGITIGWDDWQLGKEYLIGDGIALLSAALHGVNLLTVGYLRDRTNTAKILLWRCTIGTLIILPIVLLGKASLLPNSWQGWLTVISLAVVCQTFGQGLLVYSLKQFSSSFVGIFALLKPMVTALLAWVIFAESLSLANGMALILVLIGIYLAKSSNSAERMA